MRQTLVAYWTESVFSKISGSFTVTEPEIKEALDFRSYLGFLSLKPSGPPACVYLLKVAFRAPGE